jgi:hypothetical protein
MKKMMATWFCTGLVFSTLVTAGTEGRLEDFKQKLAQHVDKEIEILSQFKTCIQAAQKQADFEVCKNAKNAAQQKKIVEMKMDRLEEQKKQLAMSEKHLNETAKLDKK